jgi:hypothetical protein
MTLSSVAAKAVSMVSGIVAPTPAPSPCPPDWLGLLGIYAAGDSVLLILERDGAEGRPLQRVAAPPPALARPGSYGCLTCTFLAMFLPSFS